MTAAYGRDAASQVSKNKAGRRPAGDTILAAVLFSLSIIAVGVAFELYSLINHDVAFQLYAARELLHDLRLYVDIYEFNLPSAYYLYVPPAAISELTGIGIHTLFALYVGLLAALSLTATMYLFVRLPGMTDEKPFVAVSALLAFTIMLNLAHHFGQREHLILILLLPYVALRMTPPSSNRPLWLQIALGLAAGFAITVKPGFFFVPALIESLRMIRDRRLPLDACNIAIAAIGTLFVVEFLTLHYAAYMKLLPYIEATFFDSSHSIFGFFLNNLDSLLAFLLVCAGSVIGITQRARVFREHDLWPLAVMATAASGAFIAGALQQKFWSYHFLPWQGFSLLWLTLALVALRRKPAGDTKAATPKVRRWLRSGVLVCIVIFLVSAPLTLISRNFRELYWHGYYIEHAFAPYLENTAGRSLMSIGPAIAPNFYFALKYDRNWVTRFPWVWALIDIAGGRLCTDDEPVCAKDEIAAFVHDTVTEDLLRSCPYQVLSLQTGFAADHWGYDFGFDTVGFFLEDPDFRKAWSNYRLISTASHEDSDRIYRLYQNVTGKCE